MFGNNKDGAMYKTYLIARFCNCDQSANTTQSSVRVIGKTQN